MKKGYLLLSREQPADEPFEMGREKNQMDTEDRDRFYLFIPIWAVDSVYSQDGTGRSAAKIYNCVIFCN